MKSLIVKFLIFSIIILFPGLLWSEEGFYILPRGFGYKNIGISTQKNKDVYLRFGDEIEISDTSVHGNITWYQCINDSSIFYLPHSFIVMKPISIHYDSHGNIPIGREVVDKWNGLPVHYVPSDLVQVPVQYRAQGYEKRELYLRMEALKVFTRMIDHAESDDVNIRIISAFRSAKYQSILYNNSIKKSGIFQDGVAKPGHSEHQLGTTCDLTTDEINSTLSQNFEKTAAYEWLKDYASSYGITLTYPKYKGKIMGYKYEPWHFRYWGMERWESYRYNFGLFFTR